jgi:hypothetical protein
MRESGQTSASATGRLSYRSPEIQRIGSIAEITAASGGAGHDSFFGYSENESPPSFPHS